MYARQTLASRRQIERGDPAAHAHLAAARADDDAILHDDRRHRDRLAAIEIRHLHAPELLAALRVDGDGVPVEQVINDLSFGVRGAAIHDVAARGAHGGLRVLGTDTSTSVESPAG